VTETSLDIALPISIPDAVCAAAVEPALEAAKLVAGNSLVGEHLAVEADGDRIVTHFFACTDPAYTDWQWAVTVVRAPRSKVVTIDEVVLLPGPNALMAPPWVPWSERLQAGDLGIGDVLPTAADDERLVPGYAAVGPHDETDDIDTIDALVNELWLGRPRVLSEYGRVEAAERWYEGDRGPQAPIARAANLNCASCGFLVLMRGALSRVFGVCANEYAPDDGQVVSFDHGCGAHSEALVMQTGPVSDEPDGRVSDAAEPDALVPDAAEPDALVPDAAEPDALVPDAAEPDVVVLDAAEPDVVVLDVDEADVVEPDVVVLDVDAAQTVARLPEMIEEVVPEVDESDLTTFDETESVDRPAGDDGVGTN
jgi:hypothetical protein